MNVGASTEFFLGDLPLNMDRVHSPTLEILPGAECDCTLPCSLSEQDYQSLLTGHTFLTMRVRILYSGPDRLLLSARRKFAGKTMCFRSLRRRPEASKEFCGTPFEGIARAPGEVPSKRGLTTGKTVRPASRF